MTAPIQNKVAIHAIFNMTKKQKYTIGECHFVDLSHTLYGIPGWEKNDIVVSIDNVFGNTVPLVQYYSAATGYNNDYIKVMDYDYPPLIGFCVFDPQTKIYQCHDSNEFTEVDLNIDGTNYVDSKDGPILE